MGRTYETNEGSTSVCSSSRVGPPVAGRDVPAARGRRTGRCAANISTHGASDEGGHSSTTCGRRTVDLRDLVDALVSRDALRARQWIADAARRIRLEPRGGAARPGTLGAGGGRRGRRDDGRAPREPARRVDVGSASSADAGLPGASGGIPAPAAPALRGRRTGTAAPTRALGSAGFPDRRLSASPPSASISRSRCGPRTALRRGHQAPQ